MNKTALIIGGVFGLAALLGWAAAGLFPQTLAAMRPLREAAPWYKKQAPPVHVATLETDQEYFVSWEPVPGERKISRVRYRLVDEQGEVLRESSLPPDTRIFRLPRDPAWHPAEASCDEDSLRTRLALRLWLVYRESEGGTEPKTSATAEEEVVVDYTAPVLNLKRVGFQVEPRGPLPSGSIFGYPLSLHVAACDNLTPRDQIEYRFAIWSEPSYQLVQRSESWAPVSQQPEVVVPGGKYRLEIELRDAAGNTTSYFGSRYVGIFDQTGGLRLNDAVALAAAPTVTPTAGTTAGTAASLR